MLFLIIILVPALIFLIAAYCTYVFTFRARKDRARDPYTLPDDEQYSKENDIMLSLIREMDVIPYERVYTQSDDGLILSARYYHVRDGAPIQIQCHGYRGNPVRDFCGGNKLAREMGHNTLVIDERAHGESEGANILFGIRERYDVARWVEYLNARFGKHVPIVLSGVSMGAATVLMASELPLPGVKCIVADCPFSSPKEIILKVAGDLHIPAFIAKPLVYAGAFLFCGIRLNESSAVEAVKHTSLPILLIHGEDDRFVPCSMSRKIQSACASPVTLETFPDAGHGMSYIIDTPRYQAISKAFIEKYI